MDSNNVVSVISVKDCKHGAGASGIDKGNMVCGLSIPNTLLIQWYGAVSYIDELNSCVAGHILQIKVLNE